MGLFAPDGEAGATGTVDATPEGIFSPSETTEASSESGSLNEHVGRGGSERGETAQVAQPGTQQAPQQSTVTMTNEQLASLATQMVRALPQQQVQRQQEQPQAITPEQQAEFDRQFNVVRVTPELFTQIMGVAPQNDAQMKAFEAFAHNIVKQANAMTTYQINQELARREGVLQQRYQPVADYVSTQQANALREGFFKDNPDLKDFENLASEVIKAAKSEGKQFADAKQASTYVATRVREYLTKARGGLPPPKQQTGARKHTMPATSMGGRTGSNNGSQQPVSGPQQVFGDLDN